MPPSDNTAAPSPPAANSSSPDDFPILCESCLGPNPYLRMLKDLHGKSCKVCERPFTSFRWRPGGQGMRPKNTEICHPCAKAKNVCQTCLLDLVHNLPVQVRDVALANHQKQLSVIPQSDATRQYTASAVAKQVENGELDQVYQASQHVNNVATRLQRTQPRYSRNRARVCSFFLKGSCTRGLYCPYRHERPDEDRDKSLDQQNLRDRYYGVNDPVAEKLLSGIGYSSDGRQLKRARNTQGQGNKQRPNPSSKHDHNAPPQPPDDPTVKTLHLGGVTNAISTTTLRDFFQSIGHLSDVYINAERGFAFVDFETTQLAQNAMRQFHGVQTIAGQQVNVNWRKGGKRSRNTTSSASPGVSHDADANRPSLTKRARTEQGKANENETGQSEVLGHV